MKARAKLLFSNVPADCSDKELWQWVESHGYPVHHVSLIRDYVSGRAPAFAYVQLTDVEKHGDAARALSGQSFRGQTIWVGESRF